MIINVDGLKTYDGFYVNIVFENGKVEFGPFYESETHMIELFYTMVDRAYKTNKTLKEMPEYTQWINGNSTVKLFNVVADRIEFSNKIRTNRYMNQNIIDFGLVYRTGTNECRVTVDNTSKTNMVEVVYKR